MSVDAIVNDRSDVIDITWLQPNDTTPVSFTTVTYCPTSLQNCGNSTNCTSPCTISGLDPGIEYQFTSYSKQQLWKSYWNVLRIQPLLLQHVRRYNKIA